MKKKLILLVLCFNLSSLSVFSSVSLPNNEQQVYTSVEGNVKYFVNEGDTVKKGSPLFFITRNDISPEAIPEKKAEVDYSIDKLNRNAKLVKTNSVSEQEYEDSKVAFAKAKAELASTKTEVELGDYKAPYNCKVIKLLYPQGSGIGDGNPVMIIEKSPTAPNSTTQTKK